MKTPRAALSQALCTFPAAAPVLCRGVVLRKKSVQPGWDNASADASTFFTSQACNGARAGVPS
eukprot:CAMPEP_0179159402 /NCGR_PEP_ID=MMETSP0796-20121207/77852_1 /TAXON_ID=73915 /ORGANISM="Pyrodinium bahamense, Strain pbaha01" /LENGTH=62 /DNA_ID=CAMNT_0020861193 /DNA_START=13 /DNA_END=201 /DNA_ORIENTATION=-